MLDETPELDETATALPEAEPDAVPEPEAAVNAEVAADPAPEAAADVEPEAEPDADAEADAEPAAAEESDADAGEAGTSTDPAGKAAPALTPLFAPPVALFQAPEVKLPAEPKPVRAAQRPAQAAALFEVGDPIVPVRPARAASRPDDEDDADDRDDDLAEVEADDQPVDSDADGDAEEIDDAGEGGEGAARRRRRRGGRRRRKPSEDGDDADDSDDDADSVAEDEDDAESDGDDANEGGTSRRRRRRRRAGDDLGEGDDDPANTVVRVRQARSAEDEITGVTGSTRLEAKKQRRREGREAGRRRAPIVSEAEFLARREAVDRVMVIRQRKDLTQIAVLEDRVLVEHYVARESQTSLIGNVYLGRVQNVLPSMEAAFVDIGKGRNAVLYAGEVNWDAYGIKDGNKRKIETVLKAGQAVLVQVTKDPVGHKGARLTSQISIPGRFLVYVPDGTTSGISRKLPDVERNRLKTLLKEIVPEGAGVIVRTAAEGASEEELRRDVERLTARWDDIAAKSEKGNAPALLYGEPDLTLKVVRDLFTEDFSRMVIAGDDAWETVSQYVEHMAPDLAERMEHYQGTDVDVFAAYRVDEQIAKGLDRKVWLPSGGSLVIDRTEAMTVVDVNTGKFTGSGGNLEETVTKNNLEAAEEIVRQLRLRDIGGIIVVDFIDMVLESNRDLVLRRLVECLGRDRTRHQVAEVTSLGLVQMTRKRIGTGLLEAFSENCEHCAGRGVMVHHEPIEQKKRTEEEPRRNRRNRNRGKGAEDSGASTSGSTPAAPTPADLAPRPPSPADVAAMVRTEPDAADEPVAETESDTPADVPSETPAASTPSQATAEEVSTPVSAEPEVDVERTEGSEASETQAESTETAPQPESPVVAEPVVAEPVVTVTTSVRRLGARRAAGPPPNGEPAPQVASPAATEPASAPVAETAGTAETAETAETVVAAGSGSGAADEAELDSESAGTGLAAHVPIKRKGSRKW